MFNIFNVVPSPSLSPIKLSRPMNESPISYTSTVRSASRSGSRSGSAGQVITESIIPNVHRAILKLLSDWVYLCPNDFKSTALRRELLQFLNRVSILGDHYRWLIEDVRNLANIEVSIFIILKFFKNINQNDISCRTKRTWQRRPLTRPRSTRTTSR